MAKYGKNTKRYFIKHFIYLFAVFVYFINQRQAVTRFRRLIAGLLSQTPRFDTRLVLLSLVVDNVALALALALALTLALGFPVVLYFSLVSIISLMPHTHIPLMCHP